MADHIVKRVPASKPMRQYERSPTPEMEQQLLHCLIDEDAELHAEPEPEPEPEREAPMDGRAGGARTSPSTPGPRLAHTLRRGSRPSAVLSAIPMAAPPSASPPASMAAGTPTSIDKPDMATIAKRRLERSARHAIPRLYGDSDDESAATKLATPAAARLVALTVPEPAPAARLVARIAPERGHPTARLVARIAPKPARPVALVGPSTAAPTSAPRDATRAGPEVGPKAVIEAGPKVGPKAVIEAGPKVGPKAVTEAGPKAVTEAGPKAVTEAGPKAVIEAGPAVIEAGSEAVIEAVPKAVIEAVPKVVPEGVINTSGSLAISAPASDAAPDSKPLTARPAGAHVLAALRRLSSTVAARFEPRGAGAANLPILRSTWQSRLVVPAALLVALGTVSLLLRAIL